MQHDLYLEFNSDLAVALYSIHHMFYVCVCLSSVCVRVCVFNIDTAVTAKPSRTLTRRRCTTRTVTVRLARLPHQLRFHHPHNKS